MSLDPLPRTAWVLGVHKPQRNLQSLSGPGRVTRPFWASVSASVWSNANSAGWLWGQRNSGLCVTGSLPACSSCSVGNSSPSSLPPWLLHLYFSSISCMSFHCPPSKESACSAGNPGSIPGWGRLPRRRACIVAWKIPWKEEPGGLQSMGLQRVRHDWTANTHTHTHTHTHTVSPAVSLGWVTSPSFSLPCKLFGCWRFCISLGLSWN